MRPKLTGRILFVFSDPGGAKPCLSLIEENDLHDVIAVSDRTYSFFKDFKTSVEYIENNFELLVEKFKPELIFTGTSYTSDIEKQFIKIAKKKKIRCYSFVDHWTNISKRFEISDGIKDYPDKIWVIDTRAFQIAIKEGIDKSRIVISGNPYHTWLKKWKPEISKENFLKKIGLEGINKKLLVYAPDPLSNVNGIEKYGFDELSATTSLVDLFKKHQSELNNWIVLVKLHPNQNRKRIVPIISDFKLFYLLPENCDVNSTIYFSDLVVGFFSSFLIEATIIGIPVLRLFFEKPLKDPLDSFDIETLVISDNYNISKTDILFETLKQL